MRKCRTAFFRSTGLLCLLLLSAFFAIAQVRVTGRVLDEASKPVENVTVQVMGATAATTQTKADGTYQISAPAGATLVFTSVGFVRQEQAIGNRTEINVVLQPMDNSMQNIVVVGYGSRKKSEVTGAVASVSGEKLRTVQTTNLTQALQGRIAGVEVTPGGFRPGAGSQIRVRGNRSLSASNEPLYVVDGFPVSYTIDDMNPADIESVDVLKDAAATAIYGVRGANGVIQITTRKGKAGKVSVNYQGSQSVESIIRPVPTLNGAEYTDAVRQAFFADRSYTRNRGIANATNGPLFYYPSATADLALFRDRFGSVEQWDAIKDAYTWQVYDPATNTYIARKRATTAEERALLQNLGLSAQLDSVDLYDPTKVKTYDWQNNVGLRKGQSTIHNISITAGSDKIRSSFNAGYLRQTGIEWGQDYTRYTVGTSAEFRPTRIITFGATVNYIHAITNSSTSSYGNSIGMVPLVGPYDAAGNWVLLPNKDPQIISAINDRFTVFDNTKANRVFGNVYGELTLFKGLKYRTMFGLDTRNSVRGTFNGAESSVRLGSAANASQTTNNAASWVYDNILTYNTTIKSDHNINVTLLHEMQSLNRSNSLTMSANNLIFEAQKWYSLNRNTDAQVTGSGSYSASQYLSYMGRVEYGFKNKYLLTVSNRYDNSSVLAEGAKGAWFPSVSVAWQLDREGFFSNQSIVDNAKLRIGYGTVGNASIAPYETGGPLRFTNYNWGNGTAAIGSAPATFQTPDLSWEKTSTSNLGLDFTLFRGKVSGTFDLYKSVTTDQLQRKFIPTANGVDYVFINLGRVDNSGVELSLNAQIINKGSFRWSSDFIFSRNKERIVDIDGSGNSNYSNLWLLGQPLQVYWGYKKEGIFQYSDTTSKGNLGGYYWQKAGNRTNTNYQPGRIKVFDANGDSTMSPADRIVLGSHNPDFSGSFGNTFTYKNFELNFLVFFRVGGLYRVPRPSLVGRYPTFNVNYWTPTNPSNEYQQPTQTSDIPFGWEALTYTKATFARVRNITLTYKVPASLTQKAHLNNLAFYVSAVNPFLFHSHAPYDPETVPYREFPGATTNNTGPTSYSFKSFLLGVRLDL